MKRKNHNITTTTQKIWCSAAGIAFLFYVYYLLYHFRITTSTSLSIIFAVLLFLFIAGFLYYLAYRWAFPELQQKQLHGSIMKVITALQIAIGGSVWFVQNKTFPAKVLTFTNRFLPLFTGNSTVMDLKGYFASITFLSLTLVTTIAVFLLLLAAEKVLRISEEMNQKLLTASYAFLLLSVTTCVYCTDFLEIGPGQESQIWGGGTEDYVNYRIENDALSFKEDLQQYGGFLYGFNFDREFTVYLSRTGFYTSLLKLVQSVTKLPPDNVLKGTRVLCSLLTAAFLTTASLKFKKHFGLLSSLIFSALSLATYWLLGPASHLIWYFPIFFIPLSIGIFLYPLVDQGKWSFRKFLFISFIGYFLVFLRSYDYTPVMVLSGAIPVFFYEINHRENWKIILWRCIQVCLIGLLAFIIVMVLHFIQLWLYLDSAWAAAEHLIGRAAFRSAGGDTNLQTPLEIFQNWMDVRVIYLSKHIYEVFPQWEEPITRFNTFRTLHLSTFAALIYGVVLLVVSKVRQTGRWLDEKQRNLLFALTLTTPAAMLSSWSWFPVLGHMAHHYHMNGIMYTIPFGLTAYLLFGVLVEYSFELLLKPQH